MRSLVIGLSFISACAFADEVTIEQAINWALSNSPEIKSADADRNAQLSKQISSWLDLGPRMSVSYKHVFYDNKIKIPMGPSEIIFRDDIVTQGSLLLNQPLTPIIALVQKARLEGKKKHIKESELKLTEAHIVFNVSELYLRAQKSQRMWEIAQASIALSKAQKKDGEALLKAERIHRGDFLKLELALSQSLSAEAKARAAKEVAFFSLAQFINYDDYNQLILTNLNADILILEGVPAVDEILDKAIDNRQEIKQALLGEEIASIAKFTSFAKFFPDVNFFAQLDRNFGASSMGAAKETKFFGFNLSWDFWNNGATIFEAREAAFVRVKALYQVGIAKRNISLDAMQAHAALSAAHEDLPLAYKAVEQASEAYRIENLQFKAGKSNATQLILAETAKIQADGNLVTVLTDLKIQKLKLEKATGALRPEL